MCEDDLCHHTHNSREYGVTDHQDKHRLKGPGLDPEVGKGGVSHMGGKWPARLAVMCEQIAGEFEDSELELYSQWRELDQHQLVEYLCLNESR